jgi:hypothetical protein
MAPISSSAGLLKSSAPVIWLALSRLRRAWRPSDDRHKNL